MSSNLSESAVRAIRQTLLQNTQHLHQQVVAVIADTPCLKQPVLMAAAIDSTLEQAQALIEHYKNGNEMGITPQNHDTLIRLEAAVRDGIRTAASLQQRYVNNLRGA